MSEFIYKEWAEGYAIHAIKTGELIRCKDCKYSVDKYGEGDCYCYYNRSLNYIGDNWNHYCGWAERKTE